MIQSAKHSLLSDREKSQAVRLLNAVETLCIEFYANGGIRPCREIELIMATASIGVSVLAGARNESNAPLMQDELDEWVRFLDQEMEGKDLLADVCTKLGI